ncbi:MAG: NAD(P)-dependent oxidoreductase [Elusimicrobiota bacterium]
MRRFPAGMLVTGVRSGLGKAAFERFGGLGLGRADSARTLAEASKGVEVIIHCAASPPPKGEDAGVLGRFFEDNWLLTRDLLALPHRFFVFISTVEVYAPTGGPHREEEALPAQEPRTPYATAKLASEALIRAKGPGHLILRASALLGRDSRPNALLRMLSRRTCRLGLSADSTLNYVLHEDILDFIESALSRGLRGTYNATASRNATLRELAVLAGARPRFGLFRYRTPSIDNGRIRALSPAFARSTRATVELFQSRRRR